MSSPQNYTLFIDESGDHHYGQMNDPASRYLCLLGAWMPDSEVTRFEIELKALKDRIFGIIPGKPVILVRSHLINKKGVFGVLNDTKICADFDSSLLALLNGLDMKLIAVLIDKKNHLSRYSSPYHPYHYCLAAMLDRYSGWLNFKNRMGIVIAEGRGRLENLQLSTAYQSVYNGGTLMFNYRHHQKALAAANIATIPKSANLAGLQLCDLPPRILPNNSYFNNRELLLLSRIMFLRTR